MSNILSVVADNGIVRAFGVAAFAVGTVTLIVCELATLPIIRASTYDNIKASGDNLRPAKENQVGVKARKMLAPPSLK